MEINAPLPVRVRGQQSPSSHIASHHHKIHNGEGASRARFEASHRLLAPLAITGTRPAWANSTHGWLLAVNSPRAEQRPLVSTNTTAQRPARASPHTAWHASLQQAQ